MIVRSVQILFRVSEKASGSVRYRYPQWQKEESKLPSEERRTRKAKKASTTLQKFVIVHPEFPSESAKRDKTKAPANKLAKAEKEAAPASSSLEQRYGYGPHLNRMTPTDRILKLIAVSQEALRILLFNQLHPFVVQYRDRLVDLTTRCVMIGVPKPQSPTNYKKFPPPLPGDQRWT